MPKGPRGEKRPADSVGMSVMVARIATGEEEDTRHFSPNRRKSGLAGSRARMETTDAERRSEIATQAAAARWRKGEKDMQVNDAVSLHSFLSEGGRTLENIKFLAGSNPDKDGMCAEAARLIKSAIDRGMPHDPPATGKAKTRL